MTTITVLPHPDICPAGATIKNAPAGVSICQTLLNHGIGIEHACEMSCACATCHIIIREGVASLTLAKDNEEDLLDKAWGVEINSRLACQALVGTKDLVIEIPRYTLNHAKENS